MRGMFGIRRNPNGVVALFDHLPGWAPCANPGLWDGIPLGFATEKMSKLQGKIVIFHYKKLHHETFTSQIARGEFAGWQSRHGLFPPASP